MKHFLQILLLSLCVGLISISTGHAQKYNLGMGAHGWVQSFPGQRWNATRGVGLTFNYWALSTGGLRLGGQLGIPSNVATVFDLSGGDQIEGLTRTRTHMVFLDYVTYPVGDPKEGGLYLAAGISYTHIAEWIEIENFPRYNTIIGVGSYSPDFRDVDFDWHYRYRLGYDFNLKGAHLLVELGGFLPVSRLPLYQSRFWEGYPPQISAFWDFSVGLRI